MFDNIWRWRGQFSEKAYLTGHLRTRLLASLLLVNKIKWLPRAVKTVRKGSLKRKWDSSNHQTLPTCLPEERGGVLHVEEELLGGGEAVLHAGHLLVEVEDEDEQRPEADHQQADDGHPQGARPAHRVAAASPPRLRIAVLRHSANLGILYFTTHYIGVLKWTEMYVVHGRYMDKS